MQDVKYECPICFRQPKVKLYGINSGAIYCDGKFCNKHRIVFVACEYAQPSELIEKLNTAWNEKCERFGELEWGTIIS